MVHVRVVRKQRGLWDLVPGRDLSAIIPGLHNVGGCGIIGDTNAELPANLEIVTIIVDMFVCVPLLKLLVTGLARGADVELRAYTVAGIILGNDIFYIASPGGGCSGYRSVRNKVGGTTYGHPRTLEKGGGSKRSFDAGCKNEHVESLKSRGFGDGVRIFCKIIEY